MLPPIPAVVITAPSGISAAVSHGLLNFGLSGTGLGNFVFLLFHVRRQWIICWKRYAFRKIFKVGALTDEDSWTSILSRPNM